MTLLSKPRLSTQKVAELRIEKIFQSVMNDEAFLRNNSCSQSRVGIWRVVLSLLFRSHSLSLLALSVASLLCFRPKQANSDSGRQRRWRPKECSFMDVQRLRSWEWS